MTHSEGKMTMAEWLAESDPEAYPIPRIRDYGVYDPNELITREEFNRRIGEVEVNY